MYRKSERQEDGRLRRLLTTREDLERVLGPPNREDDPAKVTASWVCVDHEGGHVWVWDYKGSGRDGVWSVRASDPGALARLADRLGAEFAR